MKKLILYSLLFLSVTIRAQSGSFVSLNLKATDFLHDGKRNKIYASVNGFDSNYGNSIVQIDALTGIIENSLVIGSNPAKLALTKDTNYLYVALDGIAFIKRIDLASFTIDKTIPLGSGSNGPYYAGDIVTFKQSSDLVAITRKFQNLAPSYAGVVAYYKGTKLTNEIGGFTGSTIIESHSDSSFAVGYDAETSASGVYTMKVDTVNGLTLINSTPGIFMGYDFKFNGNLVYSDNGKILDPFLTPATFVGSCNVQGYYTHVEPSPVTNKLFFCEQWGMGIKLSTFNFQSYSFIKDSILYSVVPGSFTSCATYKLIRYNEKGMGIIIRNSTSSNLNLNEDRRIILFVDPFFVGLKEEKTNPVLVYPNPARQVVALCSGTTLLKKIQVLNSMGVVMGTWEANGTIATIPLQDFSAGAYLLKMETADGAIINQKLIVQ